MKDSLNKHCYNCNDRLTRFNIARKRVPPNKGKILLDSKGNRWCKHCVEYYESADWGV